MRRIKLILIMLIALFPIKIKAASIELSCPTNITSATDIKCDITTQDNFKALKLNFSLPSEITISKIETDWKVYYKGSDGIVVGNNNSGQEIASITLDISEEALFSTNYKIELTNIEASDNEHKLINIANASQNIRILSGDNTLSSLTITNGSLSPRFSKTTTDYSATVSKEKTVITATASSKAATIQGNIGEVKLNYGINRIIINVISELGTTKSYTIEITRPFPNQNNSSGNNTTNKNETNNKGNNTTNNSTSSTNQNNNQTNNSNNTSGNNSSNNGSGTNNGNGNNNTSDTATEAAKDTSLKELKIKDNYIDFNPNKFSYKVNVKNNVTSLDITAIPNSDKAKVEIDQPDVLEVGKNIVTITITKEDGTTCKYEVIVNREKEKTTNEKDSLTTGENKKTNKELSFLPSVPVIIATIIIIGAALILFIVKRRIFNKDN